MAAFGMTLGDIAVALIYKASINGHWWASVVVIALAFLTLLAWMAFLITLNVRREKRTVTPSA